MSEQGTPKNHLKSVQLLGSTIVQILGSTTLPSLGAWIVCSGES
jgi:hypothetical protein